MVVDFASEWISESIDDLFFLVLDLLLSPLRAIIAFLLRTSSPPSTPPRYTDEWHDTGWRLPDE